MLDKDFSLQDFNYSRTCFGETKQNLYFHQKGFCHEVTDVLVHSGLK